MSDLNAKHCKACEGGIPPLVTDAVQQLLKQTPNWELTQNGRILSRRFTFKDFYMTMAFVNAIAWMAHQENHHPDLEVGFNYCIVNYTTHAVGGLTENDFICAAKVNAML